MRQNINFGYGGQGHRVQFTGRSWTVFSGVNPVKWDLGSQDEAIRYIDGEVDPKANEDAGISGGERFVPAKKA